MKVVLVIHIQVHMYVQHDKLKLSGTHTYIHRDNHWRHTYFGATPEPQLDGRTLTELGGDKQLKAEGVGNVTKSKKCKECH